MGYNDAHRLNQRIEMKPLHIEPKKDFVGRKLELIALKKIGHSKSPSIIIMYGRRRVGKTELLEQSFRDRNLLKFEGLEGKPVAQQLTHVMAQLARYTEEPLLAKTLVESWSEFFPILSKYTQKGTWTIYLEELQWLANYENGLVSELKFVWDNYFRRNSNLIVILCGSAPSFMIDQVVHSKALYNRSQHEFHLKELNIIEAKQFLKSRGQREIFEAYLTVGGIPEYLNWVNTNSSVFLSLCENSFKAKSFFSREYEKIFTSNLSKNKFYRKIIDTLSKRRFLSRIELSDLLDIPLGGSLTNILEDLEKCGFISKYYPYNLGENTKLIRYMISDNYLHFYYKFIHPIKNKIENGDYNQHPKSAINMGSYLKWLGFSFERFCRKYHTVIAKILGFSAIQYQHGVFFNRATEAESPGYQIDLIFDRADNVITICEIKFLEGKVKTEVINEFENKLSLFPNKKEKTIQKVLICSEGADNALLRRSYFDEIITASQILDEHYWS